MIATIMTIIKNTIFLSFGAKGLLDNPNADWTELSFGKVICAPSPNKPPPSLLVAVISIFCAAESASASAPLSSAVTNAWYALLGGLFEVTVKVQVLPDNVIACLGAPELPNLTKHLFESCLLIVAVMVSSASTGFEKVTAVGAVGLLKSTVTVVAESATASAAPTPVDTPVTEPRLVSSRS